MFDIKPPEEFLNIFLKKDDKKKINPPVEVVKQEPQNLTEN
jgi:hypothetical protein